MQVNGARAKVFAIILLCIAVGCGLSTAERDEQESNERAARLAHPEVTYVEQVSPTRAFVYGFLPFGVGGFYVDHKWLGASGFLWPFSMIWLPKMAYDAAVDRNHENFEMRMMEALEKKDSNDSSE